MLYLNMQVQVTMAIHKCCMQPTYRFSAGANCTKCGHKVVKKFDGSLFSLHLQQLKLSTGCQRASSLAFLLSGFKRSTPPRTARAVERNKALSTVSG